MQFPNLFSYFLSKFLYFFLREVFLNVPSCDVLGLYWNKMALIWREREHEEQDLAVANDLATIQTLRDCGLLKFLWFPRMRQHMELLAYIFRAWDV